jgi:hypothetical protein
MKIDINKANEGHYFGLTEWLKINVGIEGVDYRWIGNEDSVFLKSVEIVDSEKDLMATLRWS